MSDTSSDLRGAGSDWPRFGFMAGHINEGRRIIRDAELLAEVHEGRVTEWDNVPALLQV